MRRCSYFSFLLCLSFILTIDWTILTLTGRAQDNFAQLNPASLRQNWPVTREVVAKDLQAVLSLSSITDAQQEADIHELLNLREVFIEKVNERWATALCHKVGIAPYPSQTYQQALGSCLFFPTQIIFHNPYILERYIFKNLGVTTSLAIAANFYDPVALYYLKDAWQCVYYYDPHHSSEVGRSFVSKAFEIFTQARSSHPEATYYLYNIICEKSIFACRLEEKNPQNRKQLEEISTYVPQAHHDLGYLYMGNKETYLQSISHYLKASEEGILRAGFMGAHVLDNMIEKDTELAQRVGLDYATRQKLIVAAQGLGLYRLAVNAMDQGNKERAKALFLEAGAKGIKGAFGRLSHYIIDHEIAGTKEEALYYIQLADGPKNAWESNGLAYNLRQTDPQTSILLYQEAVLTKSDFQAYDYLMELYNQSPAHRSLISIPLTTLQKWQQVLRAELDRLFLFIRNIR